MKTTSKNIFLHIVCTMNNSIGKIVFCPSCGWLFGMFFFLRFFSHPFLLSIRFILFPFFCFSCFFGGATQTVNIKKHDHFLEGSVSRISKRLAFCFCAFHFVPDCFSFFHSSILFFVLVCLFFLISRSGLLRLYQRC